MVLPALMRGSSHSLWASVLAGEGANMQRDHASHSARHLKDLESADSIGLRAGTRAVSRLNPRRVPSGAMPIIFDPRIGGSLIGHVLGAMTGPAVTRKASFLLGKKGERILPDGLNIVDDPLRVRGLRSRPFDGEGPADREAQPDRRRHADRLAARQRLGAPAGRTPDRPCHARRRIAGCRRDAMSISKAAPT